MATLAVSCLIFTSFVALGMSAVRLEANPQEVTIASTESLNLRCALVDKSPSIVFSLSVSHSTAAHNTDYTYLASVNSFDGKLKLISPDISNAAGLIDNADTSYISLAWKNPTFKRTGNYKCEAIGIDSSGKPVFLSAVTTVRASNNDVDALVEMLENVTSLYKQSQQSIEILNSSYEKTAQAILDIKNDSLQLATSVNRLNIAIVNQCKELRAEFEASFTDVKNSLKSVQQTLENNKESAIREESNVYHCGLRKRDFPIVLDSTHLAEDVIVTFKTPFSRPPTILQSVVRWDVNKNTNFRLHVQKLNVTNSGFVGRCIRWADTVIYDVTVEWTAVNIPPV